MESKAVKVPVQFAELCLQAFTARQDLINWVKDLIEKNVINSNIYYVGIIYSFKLITTLCFLY